MIRAAGYVRVSTEEQALGGESLEMQKAAIQSYAKKEGWKLLKIYEDAGISGAKLDRPALLALRRDAEAGKFEKVIFKKLTRFGRNARDLITLYDEFDTKFKVGLVSLEEQIDTSTPAGRLIRTVLSGMSEFERDTIETQLRTGKYNRLRKNETFNGRVPFGYEWNRETKKMIIVEDEKTLQEILFELFDSMGNRVFVCDNGEDALLEFKKGGYDVIVTDYGIKGITGIELATRAKEIDERVVTVLLSGWMLSDLKSYKNVVDVFLPKPFKLDDLIKEISKTIQARVK